ENGAVAPPCAVPTPPAVDPQAPQRLDPIDVDQMRRARQAKRHDRHQALAAGEHAPVLARYLGKGLDRLFDRLGRVISERRGLHRCSPRIRWRSKHGRTITADCPIFGKLIFFWIDAQLLVYVKKLRPTRYGPTEMKPPPFRYHDPKTVSEAVGLLGSLENAKLLAGGQ